MKVAIFTSNGLRHKYFVHQICAEWEVVLVAIEEKEFQPDKIEAPLHRPTLVSDWFAARDSAEKKYFSSAIDFEPPVSAKLVNLSPKGLSDSSFLSNFEQLNFDVGVVFGTSILSPAFINSCSGKLINMHLGLSPYYRGSGTNFWPIYDQKLEYIGVTVHMIDQGVDTGDIIHQGRPIIEEEDTPHTLGCKTIKVGISLMQRTLQEYQVGGLTTQPQKGETFRFCKRKDFTAESIDVVSKYLHQGLIRKYAENGGRKVDLVE